MSDDRGTRNEVGARASARDLEQSARDWWRVTISDAEGDRGVRAQLRRCGTPLDAICIPAAIGLARRLGRVPDADAPAWKQRAFERVLGLAVVLAHVRADSEESLLRALGWRQFPYDKKAADVGVADRPKLSELRFKRLLQLEGEDELIAAFVRLVAQADYKTDIAKLARVFLRWDDDRTKRDVALAYFRANAASERNPDPETSP